MIGERKKCGAVGMGGLGGSFLLPVGALMKKKNVWDGADVEHKNPACRQGEFSGVVWLSYLVSESRIPPRGVKFSGS